MSSKAAKKPRATFTEHTTYTTIRIPRSGFAPMLLLEAMAETERVQQILVCISGDDLVLRLEKNFDFYDIEPENFVAYINANL